MKKVLKLSFLFPLIFINQSAIADDWKGNAEAGFISASGNTESETINAGLRFTKDGTTWNHDIAFNAYKASSDNVDSASNIKAEYTLKRNLTTRSNLFASTSYLDDDFDGFTEQVSVSAGYGYKLIDTEPKAWEVGVGVGYRDTSELTKLANGTEIEGKDLSNATLVFRSDYRHQLTSNTEFVDAFRAEAGSKNTFIENDLALIVNMNETFALKAGFIIRHNTDPSEGSDDTDTITSLNLVYKFAK
jgi:putative salt-induced outer membrane protein